MDKQQFLSQQYIMLCEEIKEARGRVFKIFGFGLIAVPASHFMAKTYKIDILILLIPALVIVVSLLYLAENNSIMRAGCFIKMHIESQVDGVVGWEHWLETPGNFKTRASDKYMLICSCLLFLVYYSASTSIAAKYAIAEYGLIFTAVLTIVYVAIGIWFFIWLIKSTSFSTNA